jgi:MFS family permease
MPPSGFPPSENRQERIPLLRAASLQLFFFIATGAGLPFFSLYFKKVLVTGQNVPAYVLIGTIFFIQSTLGILSTPLAGFICDRFRIENRLLMLLSLVVALSAAILAVPGFGFGSPWPLQLRFFIILGGYILNGLFVKPVLPLIDTETLNVLHNRFESGLWYGRIRMFGSLGWVVGASLFGLILNRTGGLSYSIVGYGVGFLILALIASSGFREVITPVSIPWTHLKRDRMFKRFLIFVFFNGVGLLSSFTFTSFFMDDWGASYLIIGISIGLAAIPELPIMFFSKRIVESLGNRWMIVTGVLVETLKLAVFVYIARSGKIWLFLPVQMLHGVGYSLQHTGEIDLIDRQAHKHMRAMYQSLFHVCMYMAAAVGNLLASFVLKKAGSAWLMGIDAALLLLSAVYFIVLVAGHEPTGRSMPQLDD